MAKGAEYALTLVSAAKGGRQAVMALLPADMGHSELKKLKESLELAVSLSADATGMCMRTDSSQARARRARSAGPHRLASVADEAR